MAEISSLKDKRIVLAVGGGIAAYKAAFVVRLLVKEGAEVQVVMTRSSTEFITPLTLQTLSGQPVATSLFDLSVEADIGHIRIADEADLVIIAPATANLLARMARGMTDDVVTAVVSATRAPILLAPSMNVNMWSNPLTQDCLERLVERRGVHVIGPGSGFLACQWDGQGRLSEPEDIVFAARAVLTPQDLQGRHLVVSAAGTREAVDPVRFLGNRSTGKMGFAIAKAAVLRGARVTLVTGPSSLTTPHQVSRVDVVDAASMRHEVLSASRDADAVVMAAAVADYRPKSPSPQKVSKGDLGMTLELERTEDILAELGAASSPKPILVGFAAESEEMLTKARAKRKRKNLDLIVANDISRPDSGFGADDNQVTLISSDEEESLPLLDKGLVGDRILDWIVAKMARSL